MRPDMKKGQATNPPLDRSATMAIAGGQSALKRGNPVPFGAKGQGDCDTLKGKRMTTYVLTYDLIKRKDYQTLWDELERLEAHRALASFWLVNFNGTARDAVDHFGRYIDNDDKLWVSELTSKRSFTKANAGTNDWLKNNPPAR
jgi:hypothetical protein